MTAIVRRLELIPKNMAAFVHIPVVH
jgi:hypothetical protein